MSNQPPIWAQIHTVTPDGTTHFLDDVDITGILSESGISPWIDATHPDYGASPSLADNTAAIQAALTRAASTGAQGTPSTVFLPTGIFKIKAPLFIPSWVVLRGGSARGSVLIADPTFAPAGPMIYGGLHDNASVFGSRVEDIWIDCNRVAGSIGYFSNQLNELCGIKRVTVTRYMDKGIQINVDPLIVGGYNWLMEDIELAASDTSTGTFGVYLNALAGGFGYGKVTRCTVTTNLPSGQIGTTGVYVGGAGEMAAWLEDIHVENHVNGIHFDTNGIGTGIGLTAGGASFTTNAVLLDAARQVCLMGVRGTNVTNLIVDHRSSVTIAPFWYGFYSNREAAFESLFLNTPFSKIVPGASSLAIRNHADSGTNILISDAGLMTIKTLLATDTMTVSALLQLMAGTSGSAPINLPHGAAPSAPTNGDIWTTTSGLFVRINGATVGPLT